MFLYQALQSIPIVYSKNNDTDIAVIRAAILVEFLMGLYATFSIIILEYCKLTLILAMMEKNLVLERLLRQIPHRLLSYKYLHGQS